ncbi:hypothetical protein BJX68DRAFT_255612 [Aspergillus pseudodeflectus]|uniref:SH3 domain-containing protein n=1 Tax=Aspergillus pseudodeflectus TaxID=176178 RepID=A0ABR4K9N1_9EURO
MATAWLSNILYNPFALSTSLLAIIGWFISFASSIVASIHVSYPTFSWWNTAYSLCCLSGSAVILVNNSQRHRIATVGYLSAGFTFNVLSVNNLVYRNSTACQVAAAGSILVSIIIVIWIFYFGSIPQETIQSERRAPLEDPESFSLRNQTEEVQIHIDPSVRCSGVHPPLSRYSVIREYQGGQASTASHQTIYPYRAKAIYTYAANPEDKTEISFEQHEMLEVSQVTGKWWWARKLDGTSGIVPSDYMVLLP